jgi:tetratricopeptide (TPR) repeat protein
LIFQYNFFKFTFRTDMSDPDPRAAAAEYFRRAYELQMNGDYREAIELYRRSIELFPTAEAHTFRGWTYSFLHDYNRAIEECLQAIKVDPEFGNPYNDIGAYLIEQGKWDDAIPWFEKAMIAKRYEARGYPHFNLGRVYEHQRKWEKAKKCYAQAYAIDRKYVMALTAFRRLSSAFN